MFFYNSQKVSEVKSLIDTLDAKRPMQNEQDLVIILIPSDQNDQERIWVNHFKENFCFFWEFPENLIESFGIKASWTAENSLGNFILLNENLRFIAKIDLSEENAEESLAKAFELLSKMPELPGGAQVQMQAPVVCIPEVFEPDFCRKLIQLYESHGGKESGFMRDVDGQTKMLMDFSHKRRSDYLISDSKLQEIIQLKIMRRVIPEIKKVHDFKITRMERYLIACYDAEVAGHFRAHRDNSTMGTAHRVFAMTVNLNSEDYEGGDLRFPEYGKNTYRAPTGGAVVFSCSILHEATPVTKGKRYAFLPFFYNDEYAAIRLQNNQYLSADVKKYQPQNKVSKTKKPKSKR
ncbi:MAG: 2OG-Fe(II) oxygenase [Candidatus Caenarcaniphilales bacterium]|nr:2OG-Fe(II) oxygenase [Candidatus Caenarcaniphilales bacterium]